MHSYLIKGNVSAPHDIYDSLKRNLMLIAVHRKLLKSVHKVPGPLPTGLV